MGKPMVGDTVRIPWYIFGKFAYFKEFELSEYNCCLGFYKEGPRTPCNFTPLSELYEPSPDSETSYVSHYGEVHSDYIQTFEIISNNNTN